MKKRARKIIIVLSLIITGGFLYGLFFTATGIGIPCLFNKVTGLLCPGCGVTHMCISLMQGDIEGAMRCNIMLFFTLPIILFIGVSYLFYYIRDGICYLPKWQNKTLYILIGLFLLFGILRNLPLPL